MKTFYHHSFACRFSAAVFLVVVEILHRLLTMKSIDSVLEKKESRYNSENIITLLTSADSFSIIEASSFDLLPTPLEIHRIHQGRSWGRLKNCTDNQFIMIYLSLLPICLIVFCFILLHSKCRQSL